MSDESHSPEQTASATLDNERKFLQFIEDLSGSSRRVRQNAAEALSFIAQSEPDLLVPYVDRVVESLSRPEAQTRWACLNILTSLIDCDPALSEKAFVDVETALFDEGNGLVRLAAVRCLCKFGTVSEDRAERVWPLLDEAIQCYHGDFEFQDMLAAVADFSTSVLPEGVKKSLAARMAFDAEHGRGALKRRAQQILSNVS